MRRSDWEAVETEAKAFLEYIEKAAGDAVADRSREIIERGERLRSAGMPISPEVEALRAGLGATEPAPAWGEMVGRLARLDAAIVEGENLYSARIRAQATAIVDWSGEPEAPRAEIEQRFRTALEPIHRGRIPDAVNALDLAIRDSLPRAVARRDAARAAGAALVAVARDLSLPSTDLESSLAADAEARPIDWVESVGAVERESQRVADGLRDRVLQTIESLRATLESIRELEFDPEENLAKLRELGARVPTAGPAELPGVLDAARALVEEPVVAIVAGLLDEVRPRLVEARRLGRDPTEVFSAMNRAREALRLRIYSEALAASQEALDKIRRLTGDLDALRGEAAALQGLLDRLTAAGFAATSYREPLARVLQLLDRMEIEPARALLNESVRRLGAEALRYFSEEAEAIGKVVELARERGFLPPSAEAKLQKARRHLEDGEIAEAGEVLAEAEVDLRSAAGPYVARRVEEIERGFQEFPEPSLMAPVRTLLADADVHLRVKEDLAASLESLRRAEHEFSAVFAAHASALVEGLEDERRLLEELGGAGDELQRQIDEVQQIFNMGEFVKASKASQELRARARQQMLLRSDEAVSHAKLSLVELEKMGLEVPQLRAQFEEAQQHAREHRYAPAYQTARGVEGAAARLRVEAQELLDLAASVQERWQSLKQAGVAVDGLRDGISTAKQQYQALEFAATRATLGRVTAELERERAAHEARRRLAEIDLLAQDARRLMVPFEELAEERTAFGDGGDTETAAQASEAIAALHQRFVQLLRPVLEEYLKSVERDLEVAQSAGIEVPRVVEVLGDGRRRLAAPVPLGVAERLDAARAELMETKGFLEHAQLVGRRVRESLSEAQLAHAEGAGVAARVEELDALVRDREYARAIELGSRLEREIAQATYHHVGRTLAAFQGMVVRARHDGSETTLAENLLKQARSALEEGHPLDALQLAAKSESELERVELQRLVAEGSLKAVEARLQQIEREGVVAPSAASEVAAARSAFERRAYPDVLERSIDVGDQILSARDAFKRSRDALESAERQLQEVERFGADSAEAVPLLAGARAKHHEGAYPRAIELSREAAEKARWAIERTYASSLAEVARLVELGRNAGLAEELDAVGEARGRAEEALQARDWGRAAEEFRLAREGAYRALDVQLARRRTELLALYDEPDAVPETERQHRAEAEARVESERAQRSYEAAFGALAEEVARATARRRRELGLRVQELKDRIWVGEKLGGDTTPVMELLSEANLALEGGRWAAVGPLVRRADEDLAKLLLPRLSDRLREFQTEVVFAQEGLHVVLGPLPERLKEAEQRLAAGDVIDAARGFLEQEEDLNRRKSAHRELLNVTYLIDAALAKASEARLDTAGVRKLLDESISLRSSDYGAALAKAREALAQLQAALKTGEPGVAPVWPFRRPPSEA